VIVRLTLDMARRHPHRGRDWASSASGRSRRRRNGGAMVAGRGRRLHHRPVVGRRPSPAPRHLRRQPGLQPARRRACANVLDPKTRMSGARRLLEVAGSSRSPFLPVAAAARWPCGARRRRFHPSAVSGPRHPSARSGSGKSTDRERAILGLVPSPGRVSATRLAPQRHRPPWPSAGAEKGGRSAASASRW